MSLEAICDTLQHGDTFLDVGANVGNYTAAVLPKIGTTGHVYAWEPVTQYHSELAERFDYSPNVTTFHAALGDTIGKATIHIASTGNKGWNTLVPGFMPPSDEGHTEEVLVRRLDGYHLAHADVIKIDVEGYELPVVRGALGTITRCRPRLLVVEVAPAAYPLLDAKVEQLDAVLELAGYQPDRPLNSFNVTTDVCWRPI